MNTRKPNSMLIELVIVILFFAISAGIILQLFMAAHERSSQSTFDTTALLLAEDLAARFQTSDLPADDFIQAEGFAQEPDGAKKTFTHGAQTVRMALSGESKQTGAGTLDAWMLDVYDGERLAFSLPISRYIPEVQTP